MLHEEKEKEKTLRDHVENEVLQTEISFVNDLKSLQYIRSKFPLKLPKLIDKIFLNIDEILNVNSSILHELQICNYKISTVYSNHISQLDVFSLYCCDHGEAVRLFHAMKKKEKILVAFDESIATKFHGLYLADLLIKPVQRICKYPLLVKSLLETYEKGEEEHDKLSSILQQLEHKLNTINKEKARVVNKRQLIFYNYNMTGYGFIDDFTSNQNMKYIRESELELAPFKESMLTQPVENLALKERIIALFSDRCLILKKKPDAKVLYHFEASIPRDPESKIVETPKTFAGHDNSFIVYYPEETARTKTISQFLFYFNKKVDKQFWMNSIRDYFNNSQATENVLSIYSQNEDLLFTFKKDGTLLKQCIELFSQSGGSSQWNRYLGASYVDMSGNPLTPQQLSTPLQELNLSEIKVIKRKQSTLSNSGGPLPRKEEAWVERRRSGNNPNHPSNPNSATNSNSHQQQTHVSVGDKRKSGSIYLNKERSVSRTHFLLQRLTNEEESSDAAEGAPSRSDNSSNSSSHLTGNFSGHRSLPSKATLTRKPGERNFNFFTDREADAGFKVEPGSLSFNPNSAISIKPGDLRKSSPDISDQIDGNVRGSTSNSDLTQNQKERRNSKTLNRRSADSIQVSASSPNVNYGLGTNAKKNWRSSAQTTKHVMQRKNFQASSPTSATEPSELEAIASANNSNAREDTQQPPQQQSTPSLAVENQNSNPNPKPQFGTRALTSNMKVNSDNIIGGRRNRNSFNENIDATPVEEGGTEAIQCEDPDLDGMQASPEKSSLSGSALRDSRSDVNSSTTTADHSSADSSSAPIPIASGELSAIPESDQASVGRIIRKRKEGIGQRERNSVDPAGTSPTGVDIPALALGSQNNSSSPPNYASNSSPRAFLASSPTRGERDGTASPNSSNNRALSPRSPRTETGGTSPFTAPLSMTVNIGSARPLLKTEQSISEQQQESEKGNNHDANANNVPPTSTKSPGRERRKDKEKTLNEENAGEGGSDSVKLTEKVKSSEGRSKLANKEKSRGGKGERSKVDTEGKEKRDRDRDRDEISPRGKRDKSARPNSPRKPKKEGTRKEKTPKQDVSENANEEVGEAKETVVAERNEILSTMAQSIDALPPCPNEKKDGENTETTATPLIENESTDAGNNHISNNPAAEASSDSTVATQPSVESPRPARRPLPMPVLPSNPLADGQASANSADIPTTLAAPSPAILPTTTDATPLPTEPEVTASANQNENTTVEPIEEEFAVTLSVPITVKSPSAQTRANNDAANNNNNFPVHLMSVPVYKPFKQLLQEAKEREQAYLDQSNTDANAKKT